MPGSREEDFLRNTCTSIFPQNYLPLGVGGHEIYNFLSPYSTDATHQIWLNWLPNILEKKMLTHDARRRTPSTAKGRLSYPGDLKIH